MFSINYENIDGSTYIYFGGYEANKIESELTWVPLGDESFWSIEFTHVQLEGYNKVPNSNSYAEAILDTGTSLAYFTSGVYSKLKTNFEDLGCFDDDGWLICECSSIS